MSNTINIMERFKMIVKNLKKEGMYVDSKLEITDNKIIIKIEADNIPR